MNGSRNLLKMMNPTIKPVGDNLFYIYPLPAFPSANLFGKITAVLSPLLGGIAGVFGESGDKKIMDIGVEEAIPHITEAFSSLSGDKLEELLRSLLLSGNVYVGKVGTTEVEMLTEDASNEVFCQNMQDMFILAYHVINVNYKGFFDKFGDLSGKVSEIWKKMISPDTEDLTQDSLET